MKPKKTSLTKRPKKNARQTTARRVLKGAVGPSKKTLKYVRLGLNERAKEVQAEKTVNRKAAALALDALKITDLAKRQRIHQLIDVVYRKMLVNQELGTTKSGPDYEFSDKLNEELGETKSKLFVDLAGRNFDSLIKRMDRLKITEKDIKEWKEFKRKWTEINEQNRTKKN